MSFWRKYIAFGEYSKPFPLGAPARLSQNCLLPFQGSSRYFENRGLAKCARPRLFFYRPAGPDFRKTSKFRDAGAPSLQPLDRLSASERIALVWPLTREVVSLNKGSPGTSGFPEVASVLSQMLFHPDRHYSLPDKSSRWGSKWKLYILLHRPCRLHADGVSLQPVAGRYLHTLSAPLLVNIGFVLRYIAESRRKQEVGGLPCQGRRLLADIYNGLLCQDTSASRRCVYFRPAYPVPA
jgi:hypothetical protein